MNLSIGLSADSALVVEATTTTIREHGAIYHALYGSDNPTMEDIDGGSPLTGAAPTHLDQEADGYAALQIADAYANALKTAFTDSANITMIVVHRAAEADRYFAAECYADSGGQRGWRMYNSASNNDVSTHHIGSWENASHSLNARKQPVRGWRFSALSLRSDGQMTCLVSDHGLNNGNWTYHAAGARGTVLTSTNIKLGGHLSAFSASYEIAEVIIFESHKTLAELQAILERSYARCLARGVRIRVRGEKTTSAYENDFEGQDALSLVDFTPEIDSASRFFVENPQDTAFADFRSLRLEMLRDSSGFIDVYARFRWEISPGDKYRITVNLTGENSTNWKFKGGTDLIGNLFFDTVISSATRGEFSRTFTASAGDNTFTFLIQIGVSDGNYRDIGGLRLENLSGGPAPTILEPDQIVSPPLNAGGTYYVDPDNGNNLWDGTAATHQGGTIGPRQSMPTGALYPNTRILFPRGASYPSAVSVLGSGSDKDNMISLEFDSDDFDPNGLGAGNPCVIRRGATLPKAALDTASTPNIYNTFYPQEVAASQSLFFICGGEWIVPAQYPHPSNRLKQEAGLDYIQLDGPNDGFTFTSITSDELPALHAIHALDSGYVFVRIWTAGDGSSNRYYARTILTYTDNGNGTGTITYAPTPSSEKTVAAYAIGNHESGMDAAGGGVFRQTADGQLILFRDVADANPTGKILEYARGGRGISIKGDYIKIKDADVRLFTGTGIECLGTPTSKKQGIILDNCKVKFGRGGGIGFEHVENFLIQDTDIDFILDTDNVADTGGFRFDSCARGVVARFSTNRISGNQTHNGSSNRLYFVGGTIGEALTGHTNGYRFYGGNSECDLLFCRAESADRGTAIQNTRGQIRVIASEIHVTVNMAFWASTHNSPYPQQNSLIEHGGHWLLNSVFDGGPVDVNKNDHTFGGVFANNVTAEGITSSVHGIEDQETASTLLATTSITLDSPGTGYSNREKVTFPGGVILSVDATDGSGGITKWTIWSGGGNASPLANATQMDTSDSPGGSGAIISTLTTKPRRPLIQSHNLFVTDQTSLNKAPNASAAARDENIRGWALAPTPTTMANLFADATNGDISLRDYRPNPGSPADLSAGKSVNYDIHTDDYARFGSTWPKGGLTFDWIGRYDPATGRDAWDWKNAVFSIT